MGKSFFAEKFFVHVTPCRHFNTHHMNHPRQTKYRAHKTSFEGQQFDSNLERDRYIFLKSAETKGEISYLRRQVAFELIPHQTETVLEHKKTKDVYKEIVVEKAVKYIADFTYWRNADNKFIVEDTKGFKTKDYILKRKLMRFRGTPVTEITKAAQDINSI